MKTINLTLQDYRDSFNEPLKKSPYYLVLEYGEKTFYFSNKKKANRWLVQFKNESTALYSEMGLHLTQVQTYNVQLLDIIGYGSFNTMKNDLDYYLTRYAKVKTNTLITEIAIGRELNNLYQTILSHYIFYKEQLYLHNRSKFLLEEIKFRIKTIKRLQKDFEALLSDKDGIMETTKLTTKNIHRILKIA